MKKTYIQPQITIVKTEFSVSILTGSDPLAGIDKGDPGIAPGGFETHADNSWDIWGTGDDFDEDF